MKRHRRGVALLTALWLVVAIAVVVLDFSLEARERRQLGLDAADRGMGRAAAAGALALMQGTLDYALRVAPQGQRQQALRASDPWLDVDSAYSGVYKIDSINVSVRARDLGTQLNVNNLTQDELRTFFAFVLNDFETADKLSQTITDWRDADDIPRTRGAEKDQYVKAGSMMLPQNGPFREVEDLVQVMYMTPEIYAATNQYLTTRGDGFVNLNTAPPAVLRVLPGMTDELLGQIIALRSSGRRITSVQQVIQASLQRSMARARGAGGAATAQALAQQQAATTRLTQRATVDVRQVELTMVAKASPSSQPTRLIAIIERDAPTLSSLAWKQW